MKKKKETIGVISGLELVRKARPMQDIPFRTGTNKSKKDAEKGRKGSVRKKYSPRDY